jgi:hypothetical protein
MDLWKNCMIWLIMALGVSLTVVLAGRAHSRHLDRVDERRRAIANLVGDYRARQAEQPNDGFPPRLIHSAPSLAWNGPGTNSWLPTRVHEESNA